MSITGALFSGVSGLKAEAQSLSIISDNISNANTVGYKSSVDAFETLITQPPTNTEYTPGGVIGHPVANVTAQGLLQASTSATDTGINGNGFFITTDQLSSTNTATATGDRNFTRAGSFTVDANGNLVNTAGQFLLAVPTTTSGVPTLDTPALSNLSVANVGGLTGDAAATTELSLGANLPATPAINTPLNIYGQVPATGATTVLGSAIVYSSNGSPYSVDISLVNTAGTTTVVASNITPMASSSNTVHEQTLSTTQAIDTSSYTIGTLTGSPGSYSITPGTAISFNDGSTLLPTTNVSDFGLTGQTAGLAVDAQDVSAVIYDSLGVANTLTLEFSRDQVPTTTTTAPTTANTGTATSAHTTTWVATPGSAIGQQLDWAVAIKNLTVDTTGGSAATAINGSTAVNFPIALDGTQFGSAFYAGATGGGLLTFSQTGTLSSAPTAISAKLTLADGASNFGKDATTNTEFALNLGTVGTLSGVSNLDDTFAVSFANQNGIAYGFRTGVQFTSSGLIEVTFSNGQSVPVYKLPLATFADEDQLEPATGNIYRESASSGSPVINYPSVGGTGSISPSTLESSTTDIATEFTNMIITQRSYSANARTITTADEMLQQLLAIKQ